MSRVFRWITPVAAALVVAAVPSSASAQVEPTGEGENVTHVKNIPFKNARLGAETPNEGTDIEFATITVAPKGTPPGQAGTPAQPPTKPAVPAKSKPAPKCKKPKKPKKNASKKAKAKYKKAQKAYAKCQKARKKAAARAAVADADPAAPGQQRTFAFVGTYKAGLQIVDVTDPANATHVATWDCGVSQGDVQVFKRPDLGNRTFAAFTHDTGYSFDPDSKCAADLAKKGFDVGSGYGTYFADVTDPRNPKTVSFIALEYGSHNGTVHPSGKWFYNSNSDLITNPIAAIEIVDISDIDKPKFHAEFPLKTFPGLGTQAHDIGFNTDGSRAYVAAISHGEVIDTTDPGAPKAISSILDPALQVWHQAEEIEINDPIAGERRFIIAEDEFAGATGTGQCPNGGVHVYDITGELEAAPLKVGYWNIDDMGATTDNEGSSLGRCTAHVFQLHRDAKIMTIAYYNGGVRVVDLSGLVGFALAGTGVGMKQLGWFRFPDQDSWSVKAPVVDRKGFYMYADDHRRGLDVYRYDEGAAAKPMKFLSPAEALNRMQRLERAGDVRPGTVCILPSQK